MSESNGLQPETSESDGSEAVSFEARVGELERIVRLLEAGQVPLEESIRLLQRGMALAQACDETLAGAEAALEELVATAEGELTTQPLGWEEEEE